MSDTKTVQQPAEIRELADIELDDVSGGVGMIGGAAAFVMCSSVCAMLLRAMHLA